MRIECLSTGDELLAGDVVDTNAADFSKKLKRFGVELFRFQSCGDSRSELKSLILEVSMRADICVCSGGLGTTEDDLTSEIVSEISQSPLEIYSDLLKKIEARYVNLGRKMPDSIKKCVTLPKGSIPFCQDTGIAPAFSKKINNCIFYFLPGVPLEFNALLDEKIIPDILKNIQTQFSVTKQFKVLHFYESKLSEMFDCDFKRYPHIKIGFRPNYPEVWLKLTAVADTKEAAELTLSPLVNCIREKLKIEIFAENDETLPTQIKKLMDKKNLTLGLAESCTGGLTSSYLTAISGSSSYFLGSVVSYANDIKSKVLNVSDGTLKNPGAVSEACAKEMAVGALKLLNVDRSISITGIAGPTGGSDEKPVGTVCFAIAEKKENSVSVTTTQKRLKGNRTLIQHAAALTALDLLRRTLI